jgi:arginine/lysine/ornithine decarboxylase
MVTSALNPAPEVETPFADALLRITGTGVGSLHALPASQGHSVRHSSLRGKYERLFGSAYMVSDASFSAPVLDSFFRPRTCLARAQQLAAEAFGADRTFFITSGTTTANNVALMAMGLGGRRVLVDRTCHQSIHFSLDRIGANVTYAGCSPAATGLAVGDIEELLRAFANAARERAPYGAVVLSGSSYDGVLLKLPEVVAALLEHVDTLDVLVDEAWSALNNFHPALRAHTALEAARNMRPHKGKQLRMFVTQSAHKSMSALRQASYLHVIADEATEFAVEDAIYSIHTTSPSLPILASLDLARAQAAVEGTALLDDCIGRASHLRSIVSSGEFPGLSALTTCGPTRWAMPDPTKVAVDFAGIGLTAHAVRTRLFHEYGLYVSRGSGSVLLFNFHIGAGHDVCDRLESALRELCGKRSRGRRPAVDLSNSFVIPYPPGVPAAVPGELSVGDLADQLLHYDESGIDVFAVPAQSPRK